MFICFLPGIHCVSDPLTCCLPLKSRLDSSLLLRVFDASWWEGHRPIQTKGPVTTLKSQTIKIVQVATPSLSVLVATWPDCIRSTGLVTSDYPLSSVKPQSGRCAGGSGPCLPGHHGGSDSFRETKIPAVVGSTFNHRLTVNLVLSARRARC